MLGLTSTRSSDLDRQKTFAPTKSTMRLFGIELSSGQDFDDLKEAVRELEHALDEIGWIKINQTGQESHAAVKESYENMVKRCRLAFVASPIVGNALGLVTSYVFGEGVMTPKAEDKEVQEIIKEFWNDPDNRLSMTSQINQVAVSNKLQYDGELVFAMQVDMDGAVYVRILDPLSIQKLITAEDDKKRVLFYQRMINGKVQFIPDYANGLAVSGQFDARWTPEFAALLKTHSILPDQVVPRTFIYRITVNCDPLDSRGVPFVYRALNWVNSNSKINSDTASFINAQAQYAWKKKVTGTKTQIDAMKARLNQNTGLTKPSIQAGSTWIGNASVDMEAVSLPSSTGNLFEVGIRRTLLMACAALGIFEHYMGDPSTGNLATATAMELPMLKRFMLFQQMWRGIYSDILNFQLDMKLYALNKKAFELNVMKNRVKVMPARDYKNRMLDIDFPPILEKNIKELAEAMAEAKSKGLIPIDTARRVFMQGVGVNNIDEELEKEFQELPDPAPGFGAGGGPRPVRESVSSSQKGLGEDRAKALKLADANKELLRKMNGYLGEIRTAYSNFRENMAASLRDLPAAGWDISITVARENLFRFISKMDDAAVKYYPQAAEIGERYAKSKISLSESGIKTDIREAQIDEFVDREISWNRSFLKDSLTPHFASKLEALSKKKFNTKEAVLSEIDDLFKANETRVGKYGGALWSVGQKAVRETARGSGAKAWFVGVQDKDNCPGCTEAIAGNPYPVESAPLPGDQDCTTNCRHALQLQETAELEESDIDLLRDAQNEARTGYKIYDRIIESTV